VVSAYQCHCLDEATKINNFITNTQSFENSQSCSNPYSLYSDDLQYGFSTLNIKPGYERDLSLPPHYCGSVESGGIYKCGTDDDINPLATAYGFTDFIITDQTYFPLNEVTLKIDGELVTTASDYSKTIDFNQPILFTIEYPSCQKPCHLSQEGDICFCSSIPIAVRISYGDGNEIDFSLATIKMSGLNFSYSYNVSGAFDFHFKARNNLYSAKTNIETKFTVNDASRAIKVVPAYIDSNATIWSEDSDIEFLLFQGAEFDCSFDFGDESPLITHTYTSPGSSIELRNLFRETGSFSVSASCSNLMQFGEVSNVFVVQEPIVGLLAPNDESISSEDFYEHKWRLIQGSHATCKVYYDDRLIEESSSPPDPNNIGYGSFYFNDVTNEGIAVLPVPNNEQYGFYTIVVACYNAVTRTVPVSVTYLSFEIPVENVRLQYLAEAPYFEESKSIPLSLTIGDGSNFFIYWAWNDVGNENIGYFQSNHSKVEAIPLSALPKDTTSELAGLSPH